MLEFTNNRTVIAKRLRKYLYIIIAVSRKKSHYKFTRETEVFASVVASHDAEHGESYYHASTEQNARNKLSPLTFDRSPVIIILS